MIPVRWGERRYLIQSDGLIAFVNAVNMGMEPRDGPHGMFLLREGDESIAVEGLPELPDEYLALIRAQSREYLVRHVAPLQKQEREGICIMSYRITFDPLGDGMLRQGSEVLFGKPSNWETARVVAVTPASVQAEVTIWASTCNDAEHAPGADWKLVSGGLDFDRYPEAGCTRDAVAAGGGKPIPCP